jgi:hypothetical protein
VFLAPYIHTAIEVSEKKKSDRRRDNAYQGSAESYRFFDGDCLAHIFRDKIGSLIPVLTNDLRSHPGESKW